MSDRPKRGPTGSQFAGEIAGIQFTPETMVVTVRLRNDRDRALHFIGEPRTLRYDAAQKSLAIGLSDAGCVVGATPMVHPSFEMIDPLSEMDLELILPRQIVRFGPALSPEGFPTFEQHSLSDARTLTLEIAWSDVPFYGDPRPKSRDEMPTELWAQGKLKVSHQLEQAETRLD